MTILIAIICIIIRPYVCEVIKFLVIFIECVLFCFQDAGNPMHFWTYPEIIPTFYVSMIMMMTSPFVHSAHLIKVSNLDFMNKMTISF